MARILITGSGSGLGAALMHVLAVAGHETIPFDHSTGDDVRYPSPDSLHAHGDIDVLINCAGVNRIDWLENFTGEMWDEVMDTNARGIFLMTKACLPALKRTKGTVINIVSNASHMPMTCSLAYNASKGAAHIMTLQLARELSKAHGITVFGVSPNRMSGTRMSAEIDEQVVATRGWTKEYATEYQRNALLAGAETPPERVAEFIAFLLQSKEHHRYLTGCILPYGA